MLGVNADTRVLNAEVRALFVGPPANADLSFVLGVFDRVENQIGERAAQLGLTALEENTGCGFQADALVTLA
ncbi:hypothetical protein D3C79_977470 [compost metagenome]